MTSLKITYTDTTELPNGETVHNITGQDAEMVLNNNNLTLSDLPCRSNDETYYMEEN